MTFKQRIEDALNEVESPDKIRPLLMDYLGEKIMERFEQDERIHQLHVETVVDEDNEIVIGAHEGLDFFRFVVDEYGVIMASIKMTKPEFLRKRQFNHQEDFDIDHWLDNLEYFLDHVT